MNTASLSLYKMAGDYESLMSQLYDYETGEINQEIDAQLNALSDTVENKCIAISKWINKLEAEKKQIEFMEKQISERKGAYEKEIQARFNYLENNMKRLNINKVQCPYFTLRIKSNPFSTDIMDESLIPERFMKTREIVKTETKPDKNAIKEEVLKTGIQVPGAYVAQKTKLEIVTDKL